MRNPATDQLPDGLPGLERLVDAAVQRRVRRELWLLFAVWVAVSLGLSLLNHGWGDQSRCEDTAASGICVQTSVGWRPYEAP